MPLCRFVVIRTSLYVVSIFILNLCVYRTYKNNLDMLSHKINPFLLWHFVSYSSPLNCIFRVWHPWSPRCCSGILHKQTDQETNMWKMGKIPLHIPFFHCCMWSIPCVMFGVRNSFSSISLNTRFNTHSNDYVNCPVHLLGVWAQWPAQWLFLSQTWHGMKGFFPIFP